ncbi:hypothetical protein O6H91_15G055900 [Diphasiastrum complanatum]|uniref:Uncharacterized protein n=1 Tax=Diphasiastrum complanatum TaxID=34168 RepID=A0ACC2BIJ0_DIPCM|nr:hypothetical protein O6H91_Y504600 [Diphasiastrum complanatum]KAJ7529538.1 hypothetical protein O6H91_15G055900 [Diphasiastrum complanatum]
MGSRNRPLALRINKESHKIRKLPPPLPIVQYRRPVIVHTHSPKIIQIDPSNFMSLVQKLTGSTDTRMRCNMHIDPVSLPNSSDGFSDHSIDHLQSCRSVESPNDSNNLLQSAREPLLSAKAEVHSPKYSERISEGYNIEGTNQAASHVFQLHYSMLPSPNTTSQSVLTGLPSLSSTIYPQLDN